VSEWKDRALFEIMAAQYDPDHAPIYYVPARKWWEFWKPRWREVRGLSLNAMRTGHGLEPLPERLVKVRWS
jgi:hypothetical protein